MQYSVMRRLAKPGDIVATSSNKFNFIQFATKEKYKHVGMLVWLDDGLFVAEYTFPGYRIIPASQWIEANKKYTITFGLAPKKVRADPDGVRSEILRLRDAPRSERRYAWWHLPLTWLSQIFYMNLEIDQICSAFVQRVWKNSDYVLLKSADPGDIVRHCPTTFVLS